MSEGGDDNAISAFATNHHELAGASLLTPGPCPPRSQCENLIPNVIPSAARNPALSIFEALRDS